MNPFDKKVLDKVARARAWQDWEEMKKYYYSKPALASIIGLIIDTEETSRQEAVKVVDELRDEINKLPEGFLDGIGTHLCPSNPIYYKKGAREFLEKLRKRLGGHE